MEAIMGGLGIAGGLMNMFGSSPANNAMNVQAPPMYTQDPSAGFAGQQSMIPGLGQYNLGGQNLGAYQSYLSSALSNPYGFGGQSAANAFSGAGMGTSLGALGNAGALGGQVPGMIGASNAVLGSAFDPQGALYGRTLGQLTDQEGAYLANAGVGTSPYGAGLMGQTLGNFNIDWQNQQLGQGFGMLGQGLGLPQTYNMFGGGGGGGGGYGTSSGLFNWMSH